MPAAKLYSDRQVSLTMKGRISNKQPHVEQAMRLVAALHAQCSLTMDTIRRAGAAGREVTLAHCGARTVEPSVQSFCWFVAALVL